MVFNHYSEARTPLMERLGDYCSYCELPCNEGPDVEHVQPKSLQPDLERDWTNLLLSCVFCNSTKGKQAVALNDYLWPDRDNTFSAFTYERDRAPKPSVRLDPLLGTKATATLELLGLEREPGHPLLTKNDRRWSKRKDAWDKAARARSYLESQPSEQMRAIIVDMALSTGFWSVWMTVFAEDRDMLRRFLSCFPGTWVKCFDADFRPQRRHGGLC